MKTVTKEVYVAEDGKEFTEIEKCSEYELSLRYEIELDDFVASLEDTPERAKSRMRNDILKFLAWRETQSDATADAKAA